MGGRYGHVRLQAISVGIAFSSPRDAPSRSLPVWIRRRPVVRRPGWPIARAWPGPGHHPGHRRAAGRQLRDANRAPGCAGFG